MPFRPLLSPPFHSSFVPCIVRNLPLTSAPYPSLLQPTRLLTMSFQVPLPCVPLMARRCSSNQPQKAGISRDSRSYFRCYCSSLQCNVRSSSTHLACFFTKIRYFKLDLAGRAWLYSRSRPPPVSHCDIDIDVLLLLSNSDQVLEVNTRKRTDCHALVS